MKEKKHIDLDENINRLKGEVRVLRSALETTDSGKIMLQQREEFSRLLSVSKLIVSELNLGKVFNLVADSAREIVHAELALLPMLNEERDSYTYVAASGTDAGEALGTTLGAHVGMCGWVLRHKRSLLFGETSTHWMDDKTTWEAGQQSAVLVPLFGRKGIIGGLSALGKQGGECFTQHDLDLLTMFANQVSIAIENAQLFKQVTQEIEDRKRAEDELHMSRNMLRQVLNTMPQSVFWKDRNCVYLGCNDVFARAVGLDDPLKIIGKTDFDLPWPRSEALTYRADDQEVMTTNRPKYHIIEQLQQADGTRLWIDTSKVPLVDREDTVFGVLGVYEDITDRKEAEEKLKKSEAQLRESQTVARLGSWDLDLIAHKLEWSDGTYKLFDLSPGDFVPSFNEFARLVHPEDLGLMQTAFDLALASDANPYHIAVRIINDSKRQWVMEAFGAVRRDSSGKAISIYGTAQDITERKRAEEALLDSEKRYRVLFDQSPDGIVIVNMEGKIIEFNEAAHLDLGYTKEEFSQLSVTDLDPYEGPEEVQSRLRKIMREGKVNFYVKHRTKQGELRDVHVIIQPIMFSGSSAFHGIWHDITEIKKIRDALEDKTAEQNAILENSLVGIAFLKNRRFIWINSKMEETFGYSKDELIGQTTEIFFPSREIYEQFGKEAYPLIAAGETYFLERPMKRKNGSVFWCSISGKAIAPDSLEKGSIWILQDISERKEAEEKIRQSEQFVRKILDTVDEGFIVIDPDYRILTVNKAYCAQVGGCDNDIVGSYCFEISHKINRPCFETGEECAVWHVFATGEPHTSLHRHADVKGNVLYVETKAYPIKDASGKVTSAIETINNITEKHLLEEERLKTQKLESIGTLAGGIAHDFNNLLQSIFGYISMAKLRISNPREALSVLGQAEKALDMSVSLTKQLLTFSKGGNPVKKPISLVPMIENAARFALSGSRSICQFNIEQGLWRVDADEGQLGQVIQNIVLNADQAMPEGGTIGFTAKNVLRPDNEHPQLPKVKYVEISVKDYGIGIPEKHLQKIFDPYFTTKEKGSGLGLATSYSIIRNHGGLINVTSEAGKGTTFFIYLPATEKGKEIKETPVADTVAGKGKVLVMDDEELVLNLAELQIKTLGYEVALAKHGEAAIEKYTTAMASGKPFDIVILDLTIRGGMGGKEAFEKLLAINPKIKAIVSSGYSSDDIVAEYEKYGFKARLNKPYKLEVLRDTLNKVLSE